MSAAKERKKRNVRLIWIILIIIVAVGAIVTINLSNNKIDESEKNFLISISEKIK